MRETTEFSFCVAAIVVSGCVFRSLFDRRIVICNSPFKVADPSVYEAAIVIGVGKDRFQADSDRILNNRLGVFLFSGKREATIEIGVGEMALKWRICVSRTKRGPQSKQAKP